MLCGNGLFRAALCIALISPIAGAQGQSDNRDWPRWCRPPARRSSWRSRSRWSPRVESAAGRGASNGRWHWQLAASTSRSLVHDMST